MAAPQADQRTTRRFTLQLPLTVKMDNTGQDAKTKDVSARGVFFYMDSAPEQGSSIEFTLTLPPEITLTESIKVKCNGKVVRVDQPKNGGQIGIAAAIDQYDFINE
jgi:PilZ domain